MKKKETEREKKKTHGETEKAGSRMEWEEEVEETNRKQEAKG